MFQIVAEYISKVNELISNEISKSNKSRNLFNKLHDIHSERPYLQSTRETKENDSTGRPVKSLPRALPR